MSHFKLPSDLAYLVPFESGEELRVRATGRQSLRVTWMLSLEGFFFFVAGLKTVRMILLDIAGFSEFLLLIHHCFSLLYLGRVFLRGRARFLGTWGHC